ncbi:MAG: hypothetical protein WC676_04280 [Candidatus Omnitrophota bacterium]
MRLTKIIIAACIFLSAGQMLFAQIPAPVAGPGMGKARCQSDMDCQKTDMRGLCQNPGQANSACVFLETVKATLCVVTPNDCRTCLTGPVVNQLKNIFPALSVEYLPADSERAVKMINDAKIELMPAYILSKEVGEDPIFAQIAESVELVGDYYYVKPAVSGVSYFWGRTPKADQLDLFIFITHPDTARLLKVGKELMDQKKEGLRFQVRLVGSKNPETNEVVSPAGIRELNENKIYACVDQYYPERSWDYLACRANDIGSLWWDDCLKGEPADTDKVKQCARGSEANALLAEKVKFSEELQVSYAPLFLMDNVEIFGANDKTTAQELMKTLEKKPVASEAAQKSE